MAEEEFQERSSVKTETEKEQSVVEQETVKDPVIIESEDVTEETEPDYMQMEVKNPRIGKVLKLEEEAKRQNELEQLRSKRIRQQQEYINQMIDSVEANLKNTKEEQKLNEEFERHIRTEVYRMHGISEDKLQGMEERRNAWYQGAAFALFFFVADLSGSVRCSAWIWFGTLYFYGILYGNRGHTSFKWQETGSVF